MLEIERLAVSYGEVAALRDVSLTINKAEIITLIGGNGAGKTTTLKTISGLLVPTTGDIRFEGGQSSVSLPTKSSRSASPRYPRAVMSFRNLPSRTISLWGRISSAIRRLSAIRSTKCTRCSRS